MKKVVKKATVKAPIIADAKETVHITILIEF